MTPDVTAVQPLVNFELLVSFADGEQRHFSMQPYFCYPAYQTLQQPDKFNQAYVLNGTVAWSDDIDMSPDTLYLEGMKVAKDLAGAVS